MPLNPTKMKLGFYAKLKNGTATASDEEVGGEASNLLFPPHDNGWLVDLADGGPESVVFNAGAAVDLNAIYVDGARCTGFGPEDLRIKIETASDVGITADVTEWTDGGGALVPYRMEAAGPAVPYLDMTQPNVGPTDAQLLRHMADGRLRFLSEQSTSLSRQYVRVTFDHTATPAAGQELFVPWIWGGYAWSPQFNPDYGEASFDLVRESGPDRYLYKLSVVLQVLREDEIFRRWWTDFLVEEGPQNRMWVWLFPDARERFYEQCFTCQAFPAGVAYEGNFDADAHQTKLAIDFGERFNYETEA